MKVKNMNVPEKLRKYLGTLMNATYYTHQEIDEIELEFLLDPTSGSVRNRCFNIAYNCPEEVFAKLSQKVCSYK